MNHVTAGVRKQLSKALRTRRSYLEVMTAAYVRKTDVPVEQVELVEESKLSEDGILTITWHFRRRPADDCDQTYHARTDDPSTKR